MVPHALLSLYNRDEAWSRPWLQLTPYPQGFYACSCRDVCVLDESFASQRHSPRLGICQSRLSARSER